ncbi:hypothetical protein ACLOJK_022322 [Asimina triloba]
MAEAIVGFTVPKPHIHNPSALLSTNMEMSPAPHKGGAKRSKRGSLVRAKAFPDWPLLAITIEHVQDQRDYIVNKSVWHLNDEAIKNDPFYDGEQYRQEGGDGTGHWFYEKQEDIEEKARAELWREELIEEIEQKVGGLRELEEPGKKKEEELV